MQQDDAMHARWDWHRATWALLYGILAGAGLALGAIAFWVFYTRVLPAML